MINAKELRLGNLVCHYLFGNGQITLLQSDGGFQISSWAGFMNTDEADGIQLTPEILEQAGFKFASGGGISPADMWQGMAAWYKGYFALRGNVSTASGGVLHLAGFWNCQIQYLHQLQNLYFALTGEELEIKL